MRVLIMKVLSIKQSDAEPWIMKKHYAKRMPSISFCYGLYDNGSLIGIVTYGVPSSSPLRAGICGNDWKDRVLELNRLVCDSGQNNASKLVAGSLRHLPQPSIIVSYADTSMGHVGYVYQATNFLYTGLSAKRTDWKVKGMEHLHGQTIGDLSRGQDNRAEWMKQKYGDDFYLEERPRKHRYVYFCGNKRQRKEMLNNLQYMIEPYPKGASQRYDANGSVPVQNLLFV